MKKFLPYIVIIVLLSGVTVWLIFNRNSGTFDKEQNAFAVPDMASITKINFVDVKQQRVELTKDNGVWMVNSKFPARLDLMQMLLETVSRITTLCPVPRAAHDNVIKWMLERNIKVQIYTNDPQKPVKVYYVGGPTTDGEGTYTILEEDGKMQPRPFITYLPGLHGYLSPRFNTDEGVWRKKELFTYKEEEIQSVSVEYPYDENNSFTIKRVDKDSFMLQPGDEKYKINESYQQKYIHQYLDFYSSISFEAFDNKNTEKDSIIRTKPYCIIQVKGTDDKVNKVQLFYMALSQRSKVSFDIKGKEITHDVDHFYGLINGDKDFVLTQYYVLGKILRNYKDFYFKPKPEGKPSAP